MFKTHRLIAATLLGAFCSFANASGASADKAIRERIAAMETAWPKGEAEAIASGVYGLDAVIQGEGQKETIQAPEAVRAVVKHLLDENRAVKLSIHSIRQLGPDSALSWVTWHVTPKAGDQKPFDVKALFVWTRGKEGWRIRADMYSVGSM